VNYQNIPKYWIKYYGGNLLRKKRLIKKRNQDKKKTYALLYGAKLKRSFMKRRCVRFRPMFVPSTKTVFVQMDFSKIEDSLINYYRESVL